MITELEKLSPQAIALAYMYAKNMYMYGEDVTQKIESAVEMNAALHRAYITGFQAGIEAAKNEGEKTNDN